MKTSTSSVLTKRTDAVRLHRFQQKAEPPHPRSRAAAWPFVGKVHRNRGPTFFTQQLQTHCQRTYWDLCARRVQRGWICRAERDRGGVAVRSPRTDIEILKLRVNQEATKVCRSVRLPSVRFEHCILWLVLSIRCSVIVLIGLLLREFLCLFRPMQVRLVR